jgi:NitT/TauT family transport system substrate-binding protein
MRRLLDRRETLTGLGALAAAGVWRGGPALAVEGPLETTTIRLPKTSNICLAPGYIAEALLRAEGFTEIAYVPGPLGFTKGTPDLVANREIDFGFSFAGSVVHHLDRGLPLVALSGIHAGCYEFFAHEPVRTISDLQGRRVGIQSLSSSGHLYVAMLANHVGIDPLRDIHWVVGDDALDRFAQGEVDAFMGFPPEPQELRERGIGRVILDTTTDRPWSQYFCCMLYGNRDFTQDYPNATKRFVRAVLKAADICASNPEVAARTLVEEGFTARYDYALETLIALPYGRWRTFDPEDTMRFVALRLHEVGMIETHPNHLIAEGTDWRFFNELKQELRA